MRLLTEADGVALGMLCADIAELEMITDGIRKAGYVVKNPSSGAIHTSPLVAIQSELNRRVASGLREFGLTPAARSRVQAGPAAKTESALSRLARRVADRRGDRDSTQTPEGTIQ
jgi:P27 family predicted phage terminase small subunit